MGPRAAALALLLVLAAGCTFERRPERNGQGAAAVDPARAAPVEGLAEARATLGRFQELRRAGDRPGAAGMLLAGAPLLRDGRPASPPLDPRAGPAFLAPGPGLGSWRVTVDGRPVGEELLFVLRYEPSGDADAGDAPGALETILLVPGPEGWRVGLLHRTGGRP